jgi:hypothetical protein
MLDAGQRVWALVLVNFFDLPQHSISFFKLLYSIIKFYNELDLSYKNESFFYYVLRFPK